MVFAEKKRIAFFDFACCEGCQLAVLELEDTLLDLLDHTEIVAWREVMTGDEPPYDVAFCEGSIASQADEERLRHIRQNADILVALGSCAAIGCHNSLRNTRGTRAALREVYGDAAGGMDSTPARPVSAVVETDYSILGCPVSLPEFTAVFKAILTDQPYRLPNDPVCVECKLSDTLCVYEKGHICLGPLTRCGCDAICTRFGEVCHGCRGLVDDANLTAMQRVFAKERLHPIMGAAVEGHRLNAEQIRQRFAVYNNFPELKIEDRQDDRQ
jgi:coenzyme F420-reducing hydrogenase gamma subunit